MLLVLFVFIRECSLLDILYIAADGISHDGVEVGVTAEELGGESACHAKHVGNDEHLTITSASSSDTNDGNGELLRNSCSKCGR